MKFHHFTLKSSGFGESFLILTKPRVFGLSWQLTQRLDLSTERNARASCHWHLGNPRTHQKVAGPAALQEGGLIRALVETAAFAGCSPLRMLGTLSSDTFFVAGSGRCLMIFH